MYKKLSISKPCSENWDEMTPNEQGKFCQQCSKTVHDVTDYTAQEIADFLLTSKESKCIRMSEAENNQLVYVPETNFKNKFLKKIESIFPISKVLTGSLLFAACSQQVDKTSDLTAMETAAIEPSPFQNPRLVKNYVNQTDSLLRLTELKKEQTLNIRLQLIDKEGRPISNVYITGYFNGNGVGSYTDKDGFFNITAKIIDLEKLNYLQLIDVPGNLNFKESYNIDELQEIIEINKSDFVPYSVPRLKTRLNVSGTPQMHNVK